MRRPFFGPGLSLAVGILGGRLLGLPETPVFLFTLFLLPFLWVFRGRRIFIPLYLGALAGLGVLRIEGASKLPSHHVSHFAEGDWVSLEGRVASLPEVKEKGKRRIYSFILESENLIQGRKFFETTGKVQVFLFHPQEKASYGNRVRMRGKLLSPKRPQNPGEFDYGHYLRDQGIHAVFEGYGPRSLRIIETKVAFYQLPLVAVQRLRDTCSERLDSAFSLPWNVLLKALILGIRKGLPEEFRDDFLKTGTTHLIAISGMNITLVAGSLFFLAMVLGLPQKGAALVGLLATVGYVFLSGAGIPVVRAGWMAGLFFTGLLMEREKDWMNSLFFALFLILAFDPRALFQVGFQLSFLCVFFLLSLASNLQRDWHVDWLGTVIIIIGTFPLCVLYFSVFSWTSLFANLLAVPLFHLGVLSGLANLVTSGIPYLGPLGGSIATLFLKAGLAWIRFWAEKPWGYFYLTPPPWRLVIVYYLALAFVFAVHRLKPLRSGWTRALSVSLWLLTALVFFLPAPGKHFVLTALAVGQNELFHVEFPGRNHWLINTGRSAPTDQARWTVSPLLRRKGVKHLQGIVLTDFSPRHTGGLSSLLKNFTVSSLLYPQSFGSLPGSKPGFKRINQGRVEKVPLLPGDQIPILKQAGFRVLDIIEGHVFLLIDYEGQKFLFLPTWKPSVLKRALPQLKALSSVDVLILPASGHPAESLGPEILSLLLPRWVVFSRRRPDLEPFLKYLEKEETPFFFLSETGALSFEIPSDHAMGPHALIDSPWGLCYSDPKLFIRSFSSISCEK